jgi:integrase
MTLRYWADAFLDWQEKAVNRGELSPVVQRMDRSRLANASEYFGAQAIGQIGSPRIDAFRDHLFASKQGISPATARHYLISLKKVLAYALKNDAISVVPAMPKYKASDLESPRCKWDKGEYKILGNYLRKAAKSDAEQAELYDCVVFLVNTLLRPSELKLLKFQHLRVTEEDDGRECVWVKPPKTKVKAYSWETPSMPGAFPALERMRARDVGKSGFLFFQQTSNRDAAIQKLGGLFRAALRECGLYESAEGVRTLYSLRHTGITWRIESGAAVYDVARWARTSVGMIEKHYARQYSFATRAVAIRKVAGRT